MNEQVQAPKVACEWNDKGEDKTRETLTAFWMPNHCKNIHGGCFCNSLAEHPEHLLVAERGRDALCGEASCIFQSPVEPTRVSGSPWKAGRGP